MLSIVQSCQELRNERMQNELKNYHNSELKLEPKKINYLTLFKGIVPGNSKNNEIDKFTIISKIVRIPSI